MAISKNVAPSDKVSWRKMADLAGDTDSLWDSRLGTNGREDGPPQCIRQQPPVTSSYSEDGSAPLLLDNTAPFGCSAFGAQRTLYQRFDFGYSTVLDKAHLENNAYRTIPPLNTQSPSATYSYPIYRKGEYYPILHSQYLVQAGNRPVGVLGNRYINTTDIANYIGATSAGHAGNLIESHLDKISEWWRYTGTGAGKRMQAETISGELYFYVEPNGWANHVPCGGVFRVAFAANERNGNGNSPMTGAGVATIHCPNSPQVHTWALNPRPPYAALGLAAPGLTCDGITLTQKDWGQMHPETGDYNLEGAANKGTVQMYQPPPTGCCPHILFPRFGYPAGGTEHTMFTRTMFRPGFAGAPKYCSPFTVLWEGTKSEYDMLTDTDTPADQDLRNLYPHTAPENLTDYDRCSSYDEWENLAGNAGAGIVTGKGWVRTTTLLFKYTESGTYHAYEPGHSTTIHYVIAMVPTSLILKLTGKFVPAIRKRWYDMLYYNLRWISGCYPPPNIPLFTKATTEYPMGVTWDGNLENDVFAASGNYMATFWLSQGCGWKNYTGAGAYSPTVLSGGVSLPELDATRTHPRCVPFGTNYEACAPDLQYPHPGPETCEEPAANPGLCSYAEGNYNHLIPPASFYFGDKYMEQMFCFFNTEHATGTVSCDGKGRGEWNKESGCFCSELLNDPIVTVKCTTTTTNGKPGMVAPVPATNCMAYGDIPQPAIPQNASKDPCVAKVCHTDLTLPWEGGCADDYCECLECNGGSKTYAHTMNILTTIKDYITNYKIDETSGNIRQLTRWQLCYRSGSRGGMTTYSAPVFDKYLYSSPEHDDCMHAINESVTITSHSTSLGDSDCSIYNEQAMDEAGGGPAAMSYLHDIGGSAGSGVLTLSAAGARSPLQVMIWKEFFIPPGAKLKLGMDIAPHDLACLLALYYDNRTGQSMVMPVRGYITGEIWYGPLGPNHTMAKHSDFLIGAAPPDGTLESTFCPKFPGDMGFYVDSAGHTILSTVIKFPDKGDAEFLPHHYRKHVVITLTADHDGFGMHGGGPTSDYDPELSPDWEELDPDDCDLGAGDPQMCLAGLLNGVAWLRRNIKNKAQIGADKDQAVLSQYKTGPCSIYLSVEQA